MKKTILSITAAMALVCSTSYANDDVNKTSDIQPMIKKGTYIGKVYSPLVMSDKSPKQTLYITLENKCRIGTHGVLTKNGFIAHKDNNKDIISCNTADGVLFYDFDANITTGAPEQIAIKNDKLFILNEGANVTVNIDSDIYSSSQQWLSNYKFETTLRGALPSTYDAAMDTYMIDNRYNEMTQKYFIENIRDSETFGILMGLNYGLLYGKYGYNDFRDKLCGKAIYEKIYNTAKPKLKELLDEERAALIQKTAVDILKGDREKNGMQICAEMFADKK